MFDAALDSVRAALMGFAVQHDTLFSLLLVAPAAIGYFSSYLIASCRAPPAFILGRTAVSTGLFALFLMASFLYALPRVLHALSFGTMCAAIPFIVLVLGACWGISVASVIAWWRTRPVTH